MRDDSHKRAMCIVSQANPCIWIPSVLKLVAVEAVVVEDLRMEGSSVLLEVLERSPCLIQIIDPDARATAEVVVRPTVDGGTHDLSVS